MVNKSTSLLISVAIACYNGEKYIKEQVQSILDQTLQVDEIIISDDGSSDHSLKIVKELNDPRIHIHKNKGRHGYCGNFENAISLCTGDLIFIADQDDKWDLNRVEKTLEFFHKYPDADLVFCNGRYIDRNGTIMGNDRMLPKMSTEAGKIPRDKYLDNSVSVSLAPGMAMCITKKLSEKTLPFPESQGNHDQWLMFCALCEDSAYYLNEQLVSYRLHGNNVTGKSKYAGNIFQQFLSVFRRFTYTKKYTDRVVLGSEMMKHLEACGLDDTPAYGTAKRVYEIGMMEMDAFSDTRIKGACKLIRLYRTDMRYRRSGKNNFILQLFAILFKKE